MCSNSGCKELIFGVCLQFVGPVKCFPAEHARTHKSIERHFLQSTVSETQGDLAESLWCSLKKISFPTNINMKLKICVPPSKRSSLCLFQFFTLSYPTLNERFSLSRWQRAQRALPTSKRSSLCIFQFFTLSSPTLNENFSLYPWKICHPPQREVLFAYFNFSLA